ncbi:sodium:solute symporter family protein [Caballeronia sordidicola]|jgi:SSS family solute:Na+ symporter|uniref:Acetate permease ActP (Cation/acetate symporter) n=1 Tax=Caballeronia sordidicola TaxID=196367 RepID=A0A226WKR3_CABSO|nr:sodium:solute symporter [Caballeronia sordidicola]OXC71776.1 Acetate permease ActP (cation/acetate symporter) [Caballeronia sordidicola]
MNSALWIIGFFLAFALLVGIRAKGGKKMELEQWAVGGRGFGAVLVFLLMAGENYTTFTFLGASGYTYGKGAPAFYILAYGCLAFVMSYWMMAAVWRYAKQNKLVSFSDFFASKYDSRTLGVLVSIVSAFGLNALLVIQLRGLGVIVAEASYGAISPSLAIWIGAVTIVSYVLISGIAGSAHISIFKDAIILVLAVFLGIYLPFHYYGGFTRMFQHIQTTSPGFLRLPAKGQSLSWYNSTIFLIAVGYYMYPHTLTAVYSAKSVQAVRRNAYLMPLYQVVLLFMFFVGFAAITQVPGLHGKDTDLALLRLVKQTFAPWFVGIIGGAGLLTALVPASMILLNASVILAKNVYQQGFSPRATEQRVALVAKIALPLFALLAVFQVLRGGGTLVELSIFASGMLSQMVPAFLFSLLPRPFGNKYGAFAGIAVGTAVLGYVSLTNVTLADLLPSWPVALVDINVGLVALLLNAFTFSAVSLCTRRLAQTSSKALIS